jgi:hypothetical protein
MLYYEGSEETKAKLRAGGWGPGAGDKLAILTCTDGEPDEADAALIAKAPDLLEMLRELEWAGGYTDNCDSLITCCPSCSADKDVFIGDPRPGCGQHEPDCRLAALLRECGT